MHGKVSIICIDDEPLILNISKIYLGKKGYLVSTAECPEKALELIRKNNYDIIISDYEMPKMNGIDLFKEIKREGDPPPFILFSGKERKSIIFEIINNEIDLYISKGYNLKEKYSSISDFIANLIKERDKENVLSQKNDTLKKVHHSIDLKNKIYLNRKIFNINSSPSILIDEDKKIIDVNHSFEVISGYSKQDLTNFLWTNFVCPESLSYMSHYHEERRAGKRPPETYQFKFIDKYKDQYLICVVVCMIDEKKSIASFFEMIE